MNDYLNFLGMVGNTSITVKFGKIIDVNPEAYTCAVLCENGGSYSDVDMMLPLFDFVTGAGIYYMPEKNQRVIIGVDGGFNAFILGFLPRVVSKHNPSGIARDEVISTVNNRLSLLSGDMAMTTESGNQFIIRNHAETIEIHNKFANSFVFTANDNKQDSNCQRFKLTTDAGVFNWESAAKTGNGYTKGDTKFSALIKKSVNEADRNSFVYVEAGKLLTKNEDAPGSPNYILNVNICNKFKLGIDEEGNVNLNGNEIFSAMQGKVLRQSKKSITDNALELIDHVNAYKESSIKEELSFHVPDKVAVAQGLESPPISYPPEMGSPSPKNTDITNSPYSGAPALTTPPTTYPSDNAFGNKLAKSALTWLDKPVKYVWGGTGAPDKNHPGYFGYDCSGFIQKVCKDNGINVGRVSRTQATTGDDVPILDETKLHTKGVPIESAADIKPGDLIFFSDNKATKDISSINHVAMYVGDGKMIHCARYTGKYENTGRDGIVLEAIDHSLIRQRINKITRPRRK